MTTGKTILQKKMIFRVLLVFAFTLVSCQKSPFQTANNENQELNNQQPNNEKPSDPLSGPNANKPVVIPNPKILGPEIKICSKLSFIGVNWPTALSPQERAYVGLALNIIGSFEGVRNWANLSNNFDGMGISLGIFQQNLGMGSLQPMLLQFIKSYPSLSSKSMNQLRLNSLKAMLSQWQTNKLSSMSIEDDSELFADDDSESLSQYDTDFQDITDENDIQPTIESQSVSQMTVASANKKAVQWALSELYIDNGKTFKPEWKTELINMTNSPGYTSIQITYALALYYKTLKYFNAFQLNNLNEFLYIFDFVVQNGGFKKKVFTAYNEYLKQNPNATGKEKSLKILELRLADVLPRWQNDVKSRKMTILLSKGTVHGAKRDLEKEYCYHSASGIMTQP